MSRKKKSEPPPRWTPEAIADFLTHDDSAVCRALVILYDRQTQDEKQVSDTLHHNDVGFSGWHAKAGSKYARLVLAGKRLYPETMDKARRLVLHYTKQLADHANAEHEARKAKRQAQEAARRISTHAGHDEAEASRIAMELVLSEPKGDLDRTMNVMESVGDRAGTMRDERAKAAMDDIREERIRDRGGFA